MNFYYKTVVITLAVLLIYILYQFGYPNQQQNKMIYPKNRKARLLFAGDLMQHGPQINAARRGDSIDYSDVFRYLKPHLDSADCAVVNLETTISPTQRYTGYPLFRSPKQIVQQMGRVGFDVAVLANNHCCDGGVRGVHTTLQTLDDNKIRHTGVFRDSTQYRNNNPLRLDVNGISFALLNYTYGTNGMPVPKGTIVNLIDRDGIREDIEKIDRDRVDCIIVYIHWGWEYNRYANAEQKELAHYMRQLGVDLIIGSHPHVVQPYHADSTQVTLFSLGNFVSNQRKRYCDGGIMATIDVELTPEREVSYKLDIIPVWVRTPRYEIIPQQVGDTLKMESWERVRYTTFITDTKAILGLL